MIFQGSFDLEIEDKVAYATVNFETSLIGFVEKRGESEIEYSFLQSPIEFRKAFLEKLIPIMSKSIQMNFKIYRENYKVKDFIDLLRNL